MSPKKVNNELLWGCCDVGLQDNNYTQCAKCSKAFHYECLSVSSNVSDNKSTTLKWICPLCTQKCSNNDSTPVRYNPNITMRPGKRQALNSPPNISNDQPITKNEMQEIIENVMMDMQKKFRDSIGDILTKELKPLKEEICEMKESMNFINHKYETIIQDNGDTRDKLRQLQEENGSMQSKIDDLTSRVNQLEQNSRMTNIEIQCMPEKKDENLLNLVIELGKTINCNISEDNLAHYTRIAKLKKDSVRPRSIIVQFNSSKKRDQYLAAAIKYNKLNPNDKLNSSHAGLPGPKSPIFICEHLSATNKALHAAARQAAKDKGYKYVWVRSGRVYMRKTEHSEYKIIRNINSLNNLP